jgi:hypothetical protein
MLRTGKKWPQKINDSKWLDGYSGWPGAGLIHDIPPAAKLIESIIADLKKSFAALEEQVRAFG